MSTYEYSPRGMYRSRNGCIAGVCAGIAEYFDWSVFWTRAVAVGLLVCSGIWPVVLVYFLAAFMMKKEPYVSWDG